MKNTLDGNLWFQATEDAVRSMFEVDRLSIVTGRAGGFAFVEMSNDSAGEEAIAIPRGPSRPFCLEQTINEN